MPWRGRHTHVSSYGQGGHLWQGRFYSTALDESHLWAAARYVERNPVRAGLVKRAEDYAWSSAAAHCGRRSDPVLGSDWPPAGVVADWSAWLAIEQEPQEIKTIRERTMTGRPCGHTPFLERLETILGRALKPKKPGRKRKGTKHGAK